MMKKALLSVTAIATLVTAEGIAPIEPQIETVSHTSPSYLDRFGFKGDLRLRYESIERDDKANTYRNRYRLRLKSHFDITDTLRFDVGMRSGFANPTSGNQTFLTDTPLSDYFFQSLRFHILGFTYRSDHGIYKIGREPYILYRPIKSQLVWDNDISFHGINYRYEDTTKIITLGLNRPTLEEKAKSEQNVNLYTAQYVHKQTFDFAKAYIGAGVYYYDAFKGNTPLFGKAKGNTLLNGRYVNDYHLFEGFAEFRFPKVWGMAFKASAGFVYNFGAEDKNFGYDVAFMLGKAKEVGDWQIKYSYTDLQEDAALGAYTDSDNFGGGTASKGHAIRFKYKAGKNLYLAGNFFFNTLYESKSALSGIEPNYERVQLDAIVKF